MRIALIFLLHPYRDLERFELERTALSLAGSGVYGNPYAIPTGPTAHVSPGYTVVLAGLFRLFGTGTSAEVVKEVLACVVSALGCACIPAAAQAFSLSRTVGLVAGVVCAMLPVKPLVQIDGDWEAPYTALSLVLLAIVLVTQWRKRDLSVRTAVRSGVLWGFSLLFSSVLLPAFVAVEVARYFFFRRENSRRYVVFCAVEIGLAICLLLPWAIRNEFALGKAIFARSNTGIELHVSNNDQATPDQRVNYNLGVYDRYHPLQNKDEALKVRQLGEVAYNHAVLQDTEKWIASHPQRFLQLCAGRFLAFWFYPDPSKVKALFGDLTAVLGFAGLYLLWRKQREAAVLVTLLLVFYSAPSYLIHVGARQRYPIDWLLTLLSVYALEASWEWVRTPKTSTAKIRLAS